MATIRYFASVAEAAGRASEDITLASPVTAGSLRALLAEGRDREFARLLGISALLVNGVSSGDGTAVTNESRVDVLPPFAGG